ncbi:STAS domain-containing protein [Dactylosporangium sp. NPDC005572]|uniref:STAS domain-containing protein n=1 Tax=Dactylosporangium sp. NPDC005572 TaxID=3156889 RepID=UPI0033A95BFB
MQVDPVSQGRAAPAAAAGDSVEVHIAGRVDVASIRRHQAVLAQALDLRPRCVVVDLSRCTGVDATGIGVLLDAHRALWSEGSRLTLRAVPPEVWRMFVLARVDHVFDVRGGPADAGGPPGLSPDDPHRHLPTG